MNYRLLLLTLVGLLGSCNEQLQPEVIDSIFAPTLVKLENDFDLQTRKMEKDINDYGNRPDEKKFLDSVITFDSIINSYKEFLLNEKSTRSEVLQEEALNLHSALSSKLSKNHFQTFKTILDSSEFFQLTDKEITLKYPQVPNNDFLLYKKYLCAEWLMLALQYKGKIGEGISRRNYLFETGGFYPVLIGEKGTVAPGDTFRIFMRGIEYSTKDYTFLINGKPIQAKNGVAEIELEAALKKGETKSFHDLNIEVKTHIADRDTTFKSVTPYQVEKCK